MTSSPMFIAALLLLPAVGLVVWAWFTMAQIERDLRDVSGFEGWHFEIGQQAGQMPAGTR